MADQDIVQQVLARLDDLNELKVSVGVLVQQMAMMQKGQDALTLALQGNGKPGVLDRLRDVEVGLQEHRLHCPISPQVVELRSKLEALEEHRREQEQERKEQAKMWRQARISLAVSVTMLIISTIVNILLK